MSLLYGSKLNLTLIPAGVKLLISIPLRYFISFFHRLARIFLVCLVRQSSQLSQSTNLSEQ